MKVHNQGGPCLERERSLPSKVAAISPFVDKLMLLFRKCGCVSEGESEVEIALREALANAIIHGNHENSGKHVHVRCRCEPTEISIAVKDEGRGFDIKKISDPTAPETKPTLFIKVDPRIFYARGSSMPTPTPPEFRCSYCSQPLELETAKTDEDGQAVHEECYISKNRKPEPASKSRA